MRAFKFYKFLAPSLESCSGVVAEFSSSWHTPSSPSQCTLSSAGRKAALWRLRVLGWLIL